MGKALQMYNKNFNYFDFWLKIFKDFY